MEKHNFRVYGYGPSAHKRRTVVSGLASRPVIPARPPARTHTPSPAGQLQGPKSSHRAGPSNSQALRWVEPSSLAGLPGECHQTALLVTKSHLPVSATKAVSRVLSCGQEGSGTQPDKPPGVFCRTHKTLTWVFHLVMVQEAQGLQGIALRVPLQQPRGAALTWRKARDSHKLRLSQQS